MTEPTTLEERGIAERWATLLIRCANQHEAANFAWHMAERGCAPAEVEEMARRWREEEFLPRGFADELEAFSHAVRALLAEGETRAWPEDTLASTQEK